MKSMQKILVRYLKDMDSDENVLIKWNKKDKWVTKRELSMININGFLNYWKKNTKKILNKRYGN